MASPVFKTMDMESLRYPSLSLCRLLDRKIGTKEVIHHRRRRLSIFGYLWTVKSTFKTYFSGSRAEGFQFGSSDFDVMLIQKDIVVLESNHNARTDDGSKTVLLMKRERCNPGFVILQLLPGTNHHVRNAIVPYRGYPVVSSLRFRDQCRMPGFDQVGHGPCNTFCFMGYDQDIADCFECDRWPTEATEFICRQRLHEWPPKSLLDRIIHRGCHLVPIGDKNTDLSYIQWRLSFSAAEKDLVHSFNHTQFLVYGLMKIFLKQFINNFQSVDDILCSYFLKTAMFYSIENTPFSFWREDLLIPCFWFCLNKLISWVEKGYCPNYFVKQNNMFRGKVFGENQRNLLTVLNLCKRLGWRCIYLCEDLKELSIVVNHPESGLLSELMVNAKEREVVLDLITFNFLSHDYIIPDTSIYNRYLASSLTLLCNSRTKEEENISRFRLYTVLRVIAQITACRNVGINNKVKYRKCHRTLLMTAGINRYTGSMYLATFYYKMGQFKKSVNLCKRVISQWKPYVLYYSLTMAHNQDMYERYVCGRGVSVLDKAKSALAFDMIIYHILKDFFPAELGYDLEAAGPLPVSVPLIPYTVFLSFLCHHKLGNIDNAVTALHDLQVLVNDEEQGCRHYPIVLNMLAVCQDKLGDVQSAINSCLHSLCLKPDKNGAGEILDRIMCQYS